MDEQEKMRAMATHERQEAEQRQQSAASRAAERLETGTDAEIKEEARELNAQARKEKELRQQSASSRAAEQLKSD